MRLHHVQVACPRGGEEQARRFYADGLGMTEVGKPADLVARGGCWFRAYDDEGAVAAELHVGVEDPFAPARKAHPAFVVDDLVSVQPWRVRCVEIRGHAEALPADGTSPALIRIHPDRIISFGIDEPDTDAHGLSVNARDVG